MIESQKLDQIFYQELQTPLGPMLAAASDKGLCLLEFTDKNNKQEILDQVSKKWNSSLMKKKNEYIQQAKKELDLYFKRKLKKFSVPLDLKGTEFQTKVWNSLNKIPYGKTWSYQEQSLKLKSPSAIRAIASANGKNKIAIIIPCHRVIGKNGSLTGYAGGIDRKQSLLDLEQN